MTAQIAYDLDTTPEAEAFYVKLLRSASYQKRMENFFRLRRMGKLLGEAKTSDMLENPSIIQFVTEAFEKLKIAYALYGSVASSLYGKPRFTNDIDIVADLKPQHIASLVVLLDDAFHIDSQAVQNAVHSTAEYASFNIFHKETFLKIDIFVAHADHQQRQLDNARALPIEKAFVANVISPEETILSKLCWHQISESERQLRDVIGIIQVQGDDLDVDYLWENAGILTNLLVQVGLKQNI